MIVVTVARRPHEGSTVATVLASGLGALNVGASRIPFASAEDERESKAKNQHGDFGTPAQVGNVVYGDYSMCPPGNYDAPGRWPANLVLGFTSESLGGEARFFKHVGQVE